MFDDLDLIDDKDCSGNCPDCPYVIWGLDEVNVCPIPVGCKIGEKK